MKKLSSEECKQLCEELRAFLLDSVSETGGHLASNLGAVELTVAIHRVFDTAKDRLFLMWAISAMCIRPDGRQALFSMLRSFGGMSGFPSPMKVSMMLLLQGIRPTQCRWRWGWRGTRTLQGADYRVLALIGDGALTGGLALRRAEQCRRLAGNR